MKLKLDWLKPTDVQFAYLATCWLNVRIGWQRLAPILWVLWCTAGFLSCLWGIFSGHLVLGMLWLIIMKQNVDSEFMRTRVRRMEQIVGWLGHITLKVGEPDPATVDQKITVDLS